MRAGFQCKRLGPRFLFRLAKKENGRASPQALYRAFPRGRENLLTPLRLLSTAQTLRGWGRWFFGYRLKADMPLRTRSRLLWQSVQFGGVTAGFIACG